MRYVKVGNKSCLKVNKRGRKVDKTERTVRLSPRQRNPKRNLRGSLEVLPRNFRKLQKLQYLPKLPDSGFGTPFGMYHVCQHVFWKSRQMFSVEQFWWMFHENQYKIFDRQMTYSIHTIGSPESWEQESPVAICSQLGFFAFFPSCLSLFLHLFPCVFSW